MDEINKQRHAAALQQRIWELTAKIQNLEMDIRMWQLRNMDVSCHMAYSSMLNLKYRYAAELANLQAQLQSL